MIFKQWRQVLGLEEPPKSQTRRLKKPTDYVSSHAKDGTILRVSIVYQDRTKWQVGKTIAVQPNRGKKSEGRTPPVRFIREERLGDISDGDCLAEGIIYHPTCLVGNDVVLDYYECPICNEAWGSGRVAYACLWEHCNGKDAWMRDKDKDVWVVDFGRGLDASHAFAPEIEQAGCLDEYS